MVNIDKVTDAQLLDYGQRLLYRLEGSDAVYAIDSPMRKAAAENGFNVRGAVFDESAQAEFKELARKIMERVESR